MGLIPGAGCIVEVDKPRVMQSPVLSREEELHWLALKLVPGLGTRTSGKLLDRFRTPQAIFRASRTELEGAGVSGAVAQSIASGCTFEDAAAQQEKMAESRRRGWSPSAIRAIRSCCARSSIRPSCCSRAAAWNCCSRIMLGVVGTRRPTPYGLAVAERLSADLAHAGLTIVSGMARGIDTAAHKGALARGRRYRGGAGLRRGRGLSRRRTASWPRSWPSRD